MRSVCSNNRLLQRYNQKDWNVLNK
jgi:hypothetical protein